MYTWYIPDGFVPDTPNPGEDTIFSHEAVAMVNCSDEDAKISVDVYFADRESVLGLQYIVPARRSYRLLVGEEYKVDFGDKIPVPAGRPYSLRIRSEADLKLQFTRLDSRSSRMALFSVQVPRE